MPGEIDLTRQPRKDPFDPEILKRIDDLLALVSPKDPENNDLAREMIVTSLKTVQSRIDRGDVKILNRALRELRYAFKVFAQYQDRRKVTLFGSARTRPDDPVYHQVLAFARLIRKKGFMVVTGAGPGVMQAGNQGAGRDQSFGINIRLPLEQKANPFVAGSPRHLECRYFFTRKLLLAKEADAGVFFPGGFGTLDEAFELMTLLQTGKAEMIPLVFVDVPGGRFWKDFVQYMDKNLLREARISPDDVHLFELAESAEEACERVLSFYRNYQSMRYVGKRLVLRIHRPPEAGALAALEREFKDILASGGFSLNKALPEEAGEGPIAHLPRLVFDFDRLHFGRLRQLIDRLNEY